MLVVDIAILCLSTIGVILPQSGQEVPDDQAQGKPEITVLVQHHLDEIGPGQFVGAIDGLPGTECTELQVDAGFVQVDQIKSFGSQGLGDLRFQYNSGTACFDHVLPTRSSPKGSAHPQEESGA